MDKWFGASGNSLMAICLSCIGIYVAVILYTRIFGKRSFSKMSGFDFAATVAIGAIIATVTLSKSVSLIQGLVALLMIYVLQFTVAKFRENKSFQNIIDNNPMFLMKGDRILEENLRKANVTENDLRAKLRESNILNLNEVKAVIFETTGDISVLHTNDEKQKIQDWITTDVLD